MDNLYVERKEQVNELAHFLDYSRRGWPRGVLLVGAPGIGKTSFLKNYENKNNSAIRIYWLYLRNENIEKSVDALIAEIRSADYSREFAVFIDDAEALNGKQIEFIFNQIANYKYCVAIVFSARMFTELSAVTRTSRFATISLDDFTDDESKNYVKSILENTNVDAEHIDRILSVASGNPVLLRTLAETLQSRGIHAVEELIAGEIYRLDKRIVLPHDEIIVAVRPQIVVAQHSIIDRLKNEPESIYKLAPRQFEEVLADLLAGMGYEVTLTAPSGDGGKDIIARMNTELGEVLCLVEAKRYRKTRKVGVELVRTLFGTVFDHSASTGMLVTTSSFTAGAKDFQEKHMYRLSLRDYESVQSWIRHHKT